MKKTRLLTSVALVIIFCVTLTIVSSAATYGSYFDTVLQFAQGRYYKGFTDEEGLVAALRGLFGSLDKYSGFFTINEIQAINDSLNGSFVGIGVTLEESEEFIKIIEVHADSPAEEAGLREGDIITAIDGLRVNNKDVIWSANLIRGAEGTIVNLLVKRNEVIKEFSITRKKIRISPVQHRTEDDIAYIKIQSFGEGASKDFKRAMKQADDKGIFKIVLDLRGNPGGYVDEAVDIARRLIPEGIVTTLDFKSDEFSDAVYYSDGEHNKYIVAVLIDEDSASASEIVAGAIEDSGIGVLIGRKTFGKGVFQNTFTILSPEAYKIYSKMYGEEYVSEIQWRSYHGVKVKSEEILGVAKITTGYYMTPNGRKIDGKGLYPLIEAPNPNYPNGINLAFISPNTKELGLQIYDKEVYNAEGVLKALGYLKSTPDKSFGQDTSEAVTEYQLCNGLEATGRIDQKTREHMNKCLKSLRNENDKQYSKAIEALSIFNNSMP